MEVVVISARGSSAGPHWSRPVAAAVAAAFAREGAAVGWLCALGDGEDEAAVPPPTGPVFVPLRARTPPFARIAARSADVALDAALAGLLRPAAVDLVLHVGFGAPGSLLTPWLAVGMGAAAVACLRAAEVLCHRGTLVHRDGNECRTFADPDRCAQCCGAGRPRHFLDRSDTAFASLAACERIVVPDEADRDLLATAGLAPRAIVAVARADAAHDAAAAERIVAALAPVWSPGR